MASLLCVFAHPDDESIACGGSIACCAARGIEVAVLCLTRGEHGPRGDSVAADAPLSALGAVRAAELREACRVLGVGHVSLLDYEDGMLPWADASRLEGDIEGVITRFRPDAVVTFDADGLYWHPDHIAVHERTTEAVRRMGASGPPTYYVSMPPGAMREIARHAAASAAWSPHGSAGIVAGLDDAEAFGAGAAAPTLVVDVRAYAPQKLAALRCHASQLRGSALDAMSEADAPRLLGREQFRRADAGAGQPTFLDELGRPISEWILGGAAE